MTRPTRSSARFRVLLAGGAMLLLAGVTAPPLVTVYRIAGNSMRPTFADGDRVLVTNYPALTGGVTVGDTVIAESGGETLIKRVIGVPGDVLEFVHGTCRRNGSVESTMPPAEFIDDFSDGRYVLGDNEYFLAGDNRRISVDSRAFGPLTEDAIVGEVIYRFAAAESHPGNPSGRSALGK
jgi:signal peptidase I